MRKCLGAVIIVFLFAVLVECREVKPMDVYQDGTIDSLDLLYVQRYILGISDLSKKQIEAADVNKDGVVDDKDMDIIIEYIVGGDKNGKE